GGVGGGGGKAEGQGGDRGARGGGGRKGHAGAHLRDGRPLPPRREEGLTGRSTPRFAQSASTGQRSQWGRRGRQIVCPRATRFRLTCRQRRRGSMAVSARQVFSGVAGSTRPS